MHLIKNVHYYKPIVKVLLFMGVESVSRDVSCYEIKLSPSHQPEREAMRYLPVNNEKNQVCHYVKTRQLDIIGIAVYQIKY